MTKKQTQSVQVNQRSSPEPDDEWASDYQGIYYDPVLHRFKYLSEEEAAELLGIPLL